MSGEPDGSARETPSPPQAQDEPAAAVVAHVGAGGDAPKGGWTDASAHSTVSGASKRSLRGSRRDSLRRRSSGLFAAARASFYRSRGQSGASAETLRGNTGADFEGYATVHRGDGDGALAVFDFSDLLCCGKEKDGLYYLLIKGYHCFVFKDVGGKSPKYAIELMNRTAVVQPPHHSLVPHMPHPGAKGDTAYTTVHLETGLGDVEYKFTFAHTEGGPASKFCNAVSAAAGAAATEKARKRLGHEGLLSKRASVRYAENIGKEKAKEQPEAPVGAAEVLAGMPAPAY